MAQNQRTAWLALGWLMAAGCASGPIPGNPALVHPELAQVHCDNPLFVPQGNDGYGLVFDRTYDVIAEYFDIYRSNRFDGWIETWPLTSAGCAEPWRLGWYDNYENAHSTLQTIRRRAEIRITTADSGGYYIDLKIYKELEDLPQPTHSSTGAAVFRTEAPIERIYEVVEPTVLPHGWIPLGRDHALEQAILGRLRECL